MPKYIIEREIPGAGKLTEEQLHAISQTSCNVLRKMGSEIQWVHSYVAGDKIYCVYIAPNAEMVREHAKQEDFLPTKFQWLATSLTQPPPKSLYLSFNFLF